MLIASSTIALLTWRGNAGQMSSILGENVWRLGIPTSVRDNELEKTFCKIVDKIGVKTNDRGIESCHRVGSQGHAIVKFSHRKNCQ